MSWNFLRRQKHHFLLLIVISAFIWAFVAFKGNFKDVHDRSQVKPGASVDGSNRLENPSQPFEPFPCRINEQVLKNLGQYGEKAKSVGCLHQKNGKTGLEDIFVPFKFVQEYFDVSHFLLDEPTLLL